MEEGSFERLVEMARQGRLEARQRLAAEAEPRLRAYIYRVTLDHELTEDLCQEVQLEMVKSLVCLKKMEGFWPWLYSVAHSKIQDYYRYKQRKAAISASVFYEDFLEDQPDRRQDGGLRRLLREELSRAVMSAMRQLRRQYRAVLSLRCLEELSYSDIGMAMHCSEAKARVTFFRAKRALKKQLARSGLSKTLLVSSLALFGKITAPSEAALSQVAVASTKVGVSGAIMGAAATPAGVATIAAAVITAASVGGYAVFSEPAIPHRRNVKSLHYTMQSPQYSPATLSSRSKGAYEQWYYFPEDVDGPVFMRMQRWNPQQTEKRCTWLQNDKANYYYYPGEQSPPSPSRVYIQNYRLWQSSLQVRRLPSDSPELTNFISQVDGPIEGVEYSRDRRTGMLKGAVDRRFLNVPLFRTEYEYNALDRSYFEDNWPDDVPIVDERDQMHARGWTYFRVEGEIDGRQVKGRGRIPFVYDAHKQAPPWLILKVGDQLEIIDTEKGACVRRAGELIAAYPARAFFAGLARPWMGMHTVDIVRRDAARQRIWFYTATGQDEDDVRVTLTDQRDGVSCDLVYDISLENDIVRGIRFRINGAEAGAISFTYLQDIESAGNEFVEPAVVDLHSVRASGGEGPGVLWLIYLAQGKLGG